MSSVPELVSDLSFSVDSKPIGSVGELAGGNFENDCQQCPAGVEISLISELPGLTKILSSVESCGNVCHHFPHGR